jgi:hypothetical protein
MIYHALKHQSRAKTVNKNDYSVSWKNNGVEGGGLPRR